MTAPAELTRIQLQSDDDHGLDIKTRPHPATNRPYLCRQSTFVDIHGDAVFEEQQDSSFVLSDRRLTIECSFPGCVCHSYERQMQRNRKCFIQFKLS